MHKRIVIAVTVLLASAAVRAEERKFSASDVPQGYGLRKEGRIVIKNDSSHITAFRFFGDIREALVKLRSTRVVPTRAYGSSIYNAHAPQGRSTPAALTGVISEAAQAHGVDPRLVAAVMRRESAFNAKAVSPVGACGLMQLMPATARYLGVRDVFDVRQNVFGGTRYLRELLDTFEGDLDLALAAYNAGPGAVRKYRGIPPYRETRQYVAAIRASYEQSVQ